MLDTVMLCGHSDDFTDEKPRGPLRAVDANRQLVWLQDRLARSKADFLLVAGHYPVWSVSEHGPTKCLLQKLRPLLIKHNVTSYLCGHDHNLQVSSRTFNKQLCLQIFFFSTLLLCFFLFPQYLEESGVGYVVSGAGNFVDPDFSHFDHVPKDSLKYFNGQESTQGGFVHAEVTNSMLFLTYFQSKGTSLFRTVLSQRKFM